METEIRSSHKRFPVYEGALNCCEAAVKQLDLLNIFSMKVEKQWSANWPHIINLVTPGLYFSSP